MSLTNWTPDDAKEWKAAWELPVMQKGLLLMKLACLPPGQIAIAPGTDIKEVASQSYSFTQGQVSALTELIADLMPKPEQKPLPKPHEKTPRPSSQPK